MKPDGVDLSREDRLGVKQHIRRLWHKLHVAGLRTQRHGHGADLGGDVFAWPQDQQVVLHGVVVGKDELDLGAWVDLEDLFVEPKPPDQSADLDDMIRFTKPLWSLASNLRSCSESYGGEEGDGNEEVWNARHGCEG